MSKFTKLMLSLLAASALGLGGLEIASAFTPPLGFSIFPLTFVTQPVTNLADAFNEMLATINQQVVGISSAYPGAALEPSNGFDTSGTTFSSATPQQNPVELYNETNVSLAAVNAQTTLITGQSGRIIYPGSVTMEARGGNAATCTGVKIICNPSGLVIGSFVVANLTSGVPSGLQTASNIAGSAATQGCSPGDSILASAYGGLCATSTGFAIGTPYTVQ